MRRIIFFLLVSASAAFCELPILNTPFRKSSIDIVQQHARKNNPHAQMELALRYYAGHQVPVDAGAAFEWMRKAAMKESPDAQFLLSRMYAEGIGTEADESAAEAWLARGLAADPENEMLQEQYEISLAAKAGDPAAKAGFLQVFSEAGYAPAFVALQEPKAVALYAKGEYRDALKIFQQMAEQNSPAGFFRLAEMVAEGKGGVPEDHMQAFDLYLKAAEAGHPEAQFRLAEMVAAGRGTDRDPVAADEWYEQSAQNGFADAQYRVAEMKFSSAARWSEQALLDEENEDSDQESIKQYKRNLSGAIGWYRKAAEGNVAAAQYMLGRLYGSGEGVVRDADEALHYYKLAAEQGYADSLFYIGLMYHAGLELDKDLDKAVFFYQKAAERGSRAALFYLGNCYYFGVGVEQHAKKAEELYRQLLESASAEEAVDDEISSMRSSVWVLRAAREYALILWRKAGSAEDSAAARKWMSLVARSGDAEAREILIQMITGDRSEMIPGRAVNPRQDVIARRRNSVFVTPYLLMDVRRLYPDFKVPQMISSAMPRGEVSGINGAELWELSVKYNHPAVREAVGLDAVVLMGVELQDKATGEAYWAYNTVKDPEIVFSGSTSVDVSLFADISGCSDVRIVNWAAVCGHLLDADQKILAVLDSKAKSLSEGSLEVMASKNRFSRKLKSIAVATIDVDARFPGNIEDPDAGSSDDSNVLDSILNNVIGQ